MLTIKNRAGKMLLFFLAAVTLFTACAPPGARALLRGKKLLEQGKYQKAIEELKAAAVLLGGTNAQAYNYLGLACHEAGQLAEAQKAYQKALGLNPDLAEARYNLGCLALEQGRFEQAKSDLTSYTIRRPDSADGWIQLGTAQLREGQTGPTHLRDGLLRASDKSFQEGLRLSPQNPEALTGLGLLRLQRGQAGDAKDFFARALKAQPDYRPALLNLAIVQQQYLAEPRAALETYRAYLALKPAPQNSDGVRAVIRQLELQLVPVPAPATIAPPAPIRTSAPAPRLASTEGARTAALSRASSPEASRTVVPPRPDPAQDIARPQAVAPPPKAAAAPPPVPATDIEVVHLPADPVLKTALDSPAPATAAPPSPMQPADATAALPQAILDLKLPRYHYRAPAKPKPGNRPASERAFAQGVQAHQAQRLPEAIASYRRALQLDPSFYDACYNLALAATQVGNLALALSTYETALVLRPESSDARYNFALVLKQSNYLVDAASELEKVVAAYPNDGRAHLALGNLYAQQLQQPARARGHYLKVLEADPQNPQAAAIQYWLTEPGH